VSQPTVARLLALSLLLGPAPALAQSGQGVPQVTDAPTTPNAPILLQPKPDVHGRPGQGATEQHGTDSASPGGTGGATAPGPTGMGATMGGSANQQPTTPPVMGQ
jgi:hypothetical protein